MLLGLGIVAQRTLFVQHHCLRDARRTEHMAASCGRGRRLVAKLIQTDGTSARNDTSLDSGWLSLNQRHYWFRRCFWRGHHRGSWSGCGRLLRINVNDGIVQWAQVNNRYVVGVRFRRAGRLHPASGIRWLFRSVKAQIDERNVVRHVSNVFVAVAHIGNMIPGICEIKSGGL